MPTSAPALSTDGLTVRYGHVEAVSGVSLGVAPGETLALLGSNGAGKTSLLRAISGLVPVAAGQIRHGERDITGMRPDRVTRGGVIHVPEGRRVVAPLTVEENLLLAGRSSRRCPRDELRQSVARVYELFPRLGERHRQQSGLLSGGEQQMLAIGRALMARPDVLVLDEPSMGLAPVMTEVIYGVLRTRAGLAPEAAVILAEQNRIALTVADRACVLSRGRVVFEGPASEATEEITIRAYLGSRGDDEPASGEMN